MSEPELKVVKVETKTPNWFNQAISTVSRRMVSGLFGTSKNGKRDIYEIYGYKREIDFKDLYWLWRRGGISFRIINSIARSCWRDGIKITNNDEFVHEDIINTLNRKGKLTKRLEQADILNRIGRYSILFVGVPDGLDFDKPIGTVSGDRMEEVYFRPYAEDGVLVKSWVQDVTDPRFGQPELYQLTIEDRGDKEEQVITKPIIVHHSRIVHLAEGSLDSDIEGVSALEPIFNTMEDLIKTAGGSAEAFFRNARNRFSLETDPKMASSFSSEEKAALEEEAQKFQNEWQDFIRAGGIQVKPLNIPQHDPLNTFKMMLQIVSGTTGIPVRILTGEGAGQLAGNEDKESFNQIIQDRRDLWCSEWIMDILTILSEAGMMELSDDDEISWESPDVASSKDKSTTAQQNASALKSVADSLASPGLDGQIEIQDAMSLIFGDDAVAEIDFQDPMHDGLTPAEVSAGLAEDAADRQMERELAMAGAGEELDSDDDDEEDDDE